MLEAEARLIKYVTPLLHAIHLPCREGHKLPQLVVKDYFKLQDLQSGNAIIKSRD